jgi:GMP synthase (glutamine-hydrolysing)
MAAYSQADKPVLGICLGSQLLARAFGAENHLGTAPEFGWVDVSLTDAGRADPVLGALPPTFPDLPVALRHLHPARGRHPPRPERHRRAPGVPHRPRHLWHPVPFRGQPRRRQDWTRTFPDLTDRMSPGWTTRHPELARTRGQEADAHGLTLARAWVNLI